jgi:hypothetical protein
LNGSQPPGCTPNALGWIQFVSRQAYSGSTGAGSGNYRLQSSSPGQVLFDRVAVRDRYALDNNTRGEFDPPGSRADGNVRRGAFFF